jgi:pyrroline-5-carboxylate reductase
VKEKATKNSSGSPVLIVGAGNMGGALANGLSEEGKGFSVRVYDIHEGRLDDLTTRLGVEAVREPAAALPPEGGAVVFCVKPQDLKTVAAPLKGKVPKGCLVVSILAGVPIADRSCARCRTSPRPCTPRPPRCA